jgi:hypothetical protein
MPRILYRPDAKKYNARVIAAAINIVKRRTNLKLYEIEVLLGIGHTTMNRMQFARTRVGRIKFEGLITALGAIEQEYSRKPIEAL